MRRGQVPVAGGEKAPLKALLTAARSVGVFYVDQNPPLPIKPQSHCCDCRAIRPTAGVAALSDSMHRDAQAVKANETAVAAMSRA